MDWSIPVIVLQLIALEGLLSIDNAAVLGALVVPLPDNKPVEWPKGLTRLGRMLHPLLWNQRMAALRVGLLGAYVGRGSMLVLAALIVNNPWLKVVGALYLVRLAFDNLGIAESGESDAHIHPAETASFWGVVLIVEITDLIFSLDNVVAAVSLSTKLWVVMIGVAIGILMMRFAAGLFSYAVEREPVLKTAAYALVLAIGTELLVEEFGHVRISDWLRFAISISIILGSLAYAHSRLLRKLRPVLIWLAEGFSNFNEVFDWALAPVAYLVKWIWKRIRSTFTSGWLSKPQILAKGEIEPNTDKRIN
jgi:tellurite resistance protein TerC